jgi:hypothetical protein
MWRRTNGSGAAVRFSVKAIRGNYGSHLKKASWNYPECDGHFIYNVACHADAVIFEFFDVFNGKNARR